MILCLQLLPPLPYLSYPCFGLYTSGNPAIILFAFAFVAEGPLPTLYGNGCSTVM